MGTTFGLLLGLGLAVAGQLPPGAGGAIADFRLLAQPNVVADLDLTDEQAHRLTELFEQVRGSLSDRIREAARVRKETGQETLPKAIQAFEGEMRAALTAILDEAQRRRYDEIKLQDRGAWALVEPRIQEAVGLDAEQAAQIAAITKDFRARVEAMLKATADPKSAAGRPADEAEKIYQGSADRLLAILDERQKAAWTTLLGKPLPPIQAAKGRKLFSEEKEKGPDVAGPFPR